MKKVNLIFLVLVLSLSFSACNKKDLDQVTFGSDESGNEEYDPNIKLAEYKDENLYFSFKYPLTRGFINAETLGDSVSFVYKSILYKNGVFTGFQVDIYDANGWEEAVDEIEDPLIAQFETKNYFFVLSQKGANDEYFAEIIKTFNAEELFS